MDLNELNMKQTEQTLLYPHFFTLFSEIDWNKLDVSNTTGYCPEKNESFRLLRVTKEHTSPLLKRVNVLKLDDILKIQTLFVYKSVSSLYSNGTGFQIMNHCDYSGCRWRHKNSPLDNKYSMHLLYRTFIVQSCGTHSRGISRLHDYQILCV